MHSERHIVGKPRVSELPTGHMVRAFSTGPVQDLGQDLAVVLPLPCRFTASLCWSWLQGMLMLFVALIATKTSGMNDHTMC